MQETPVRNERLFALFDAGELCEAIVGAEAYFIPGATRRDLHDRLLILSQMAIWSRDKGTQSVVAQAIESAIAESASREDLRTAFDIAWTFLIVSDDEGSEIRPNWKSIAHILSDLLSRKAGDVAANSEIASLVTSVQARVPGIGG